MIDRNDAPEGLKRKPHLVATGGRCPSRYVGNGKLRLYFRCALTMDFEIGDVAHWRPRRSMWDRTGSAMDILFVEWLP